MKNSFIKHDMFFKQSDLKETYTVFCFPNMYFVRSLRLFYKLIKHVNNNSLVVSCVSECSVSIFRGAT